MIDFAKITKTLDGYDCHYFGTRIGFDGTKLHCFAIMTSCGVKEKNYDDQGRPLAFSMDGKWEVSETNAFAIVRPPKIVEVTRWVGLRIDSNGNYTISTSTDEENFDNDHFFCKQQHTFRFEVPHD